MAEAIVGAAARMRSRKIFHLITDLDAGGAEAMLYRLLSCMDGRRFRHVVVSMTDAGVFGSGLAALGIRVYALGMRRGVPAPAGVWRLWRVLRQERPDIMQTWLYHADLLGLVLGKLAGVPAVAWNIRCSDVDMRHYAWLSALVVRVLARLSA